MRARRHGNANRLTCAVAVLVRVGVAIGCTPVGPTTLPNHEAENVARDVRPANTLPPTASSAPTSNGATDDDASVPAVDPNRSDASARGDGGGCATPCKGLYPRRLGTAVSTRAAELQRCYSRAFVGDRFLAGRMTVHVTIGESGVVCAVEIAKTTIQSGVPECVAETLRNWPRFGQTDSPRGGCVNVTIPLNFVPADEGAASRP